MLPNVRTVATKQNRERVRAPALSPHGVTQTRSLPFAVLFSGPRRAPLVDELHDGDGDGAEQEDVYEALLAQHEFSHEPRGEERRGEQTDVQFNSNPFA